MFIAILMGDIPMASLMSSTVVQLIDLTSEGIIIDKLWMEQKMSSKIDWYKYLQLKHQLERKK